MFELLNLTKVKLDDANPRSELHGKEHVPAVDLKFSVDTTNEILSVFHPELLAANYKREAGADNPPPQGELQGVTPVSSLPNLRFPKMRQPISWDLEGTGYELVIDHGMGGRSNLVLGGCKIDGFKFAMKEGGTVTVSWRLQASKVPDKEMGKLCSLIQHEIDITLTGPENTQQGIDGAAGSAPAPAPAQADTGAGDDDDDGRAATDAFIARNTGATADE